MRERPQPPAVGSGRFPVAVVVDGWNVRSQISRAFGQARHVTYPGLVGGLRVYGLQVVSADLALGIDPADGPPSVKPGSRLEKALADNSEFARRWERTPGATVLPGRLRMSDSGTDLEEKLVDVLCAVQICRLATQIRRGDANAGGIVVLSRDMDLIPAYQFAHELGVPIWAAARETVHRRRDDHGWLLLDDVALATIAGFRDRSVLDRRAQVASWLPRPDLALKDVTARRMVISNADPANRQLGLFSQVGGLPAAAPTTAVPHPARPGKLVDLFPVGAFVKDQGAFPVLSMDRHPRRAPEIAVGTVECWLDQTRRQVRSCGATYLLHVPAGSAPPGDRVLILATTDGRMRYIGPAEDGPERTSQHQSRVLIARITDARRRLSAHDYRRVRAAIGRQMVYATGLLEQSGQPALVAHEEPGLLSGDRLPTVIVENRDDSPDVRPLVMQLGSRLPRAIL
ncbi:NYN domain-containing protein [Pseudofrankia asymbiotica]|nr:NYN domain-containing protein [Pseudofrankia asymbiotica]